MDIYNSTQTTQRSLLLATQQQQQYTINSTFINNTLQNTLANTNDINAQLYAQLQEVRKQRYAPYQPYIAPVIPVSVMELQMRTANVGVPMPVFTIANCKGSQFVTK
jgi:hypothetical protein